MDNASPPTEVKRWQKPRIYLTIVALYFIVSSIGYFSYSFILYLEARARLSEFGGSVLGVALFGALLLIASLYLIIGNLAAVSLLRKKPGFLLAIFIMLTSVAWLSFFMYWQTGALLSYCFFEPNLYNSCPLSSVNWYWFMAIFVLTCLMVVFLFKGRQRYLKSIKQAQ